MGLHSVPRRGGARPALCSSEKGERKGPGAPTTDVRASAPGDPAGPGCATSHLKSARTSLLLRCPQPLTEPQRSPGQVGAFPRPSPCACHGRAHQCPSLRYQRHFPSAICDPVRGFEGGDPSRAREPSSADGMPGTNSGVRGSGSRRRSGRRPALVIYGDAVPATVAKGLPARPPARWETTLVLELYTDFPGARRAGSLPNTKEAGVTSGKRLCGHAASGWVAFFLPFFLSFSKLKNKHLKLFRSIFRG